MNFKKLQQMQAKLDEAILADKAPMTAEERLKQPQLNENQQIVLEWLKKLLN